MAVLTPSPKMQFFDINGEPLVGGKVYTYQAGTTTPQATYTDNTGATANPNPVILNARGEASIWLSGANFKFKLTDANDVEIWTVDYISAPISGVSPALSGNVTIDTSSSSPALKITQTGTGLALRVQDEADPDSTPTVVDNQGRLGVGTASPSEKVDISGGNLAFTAAAGTLYAKVTPGASSTDIAAAGARSLILTTNSTPRISITDTGLVGIGKTPSAGIELDVAGDIAASVSVKTDTITELTSGAGVTVGGVLLKNSLVGGVYRPITTATAQTTNATNIDFTGIPSWVKRITLSFSSVATTGSTSVYPLVQLGISTGFETTGYLSASIEIGLGGRQFTTGFGINSGSTDAFSGQLVFTNITGNTWVMSGTTIRYVGTTGHISTGTKTLGGTLDRLRVTTANTTSYSSGTVNIFYE